MPDYLEIGAGRRIAYHRTAGAGPGVVFLGGFKSDMEGTKALHLEAWARETGRAFLRFDYTGHGQSSGAFEAGCVGDWADDSREAVERLTDGPQVLVGSSMGGWIGLLLANAAPQRLAGFVGVAAAPDFTASMEAEMDAAARAEMAETGRYARPSDYSDEPYVITRRLIEDGARRQVLTSPLRLDVPVRLLQGTADADVPVAVALGLLDHLEGPDVRLTLVKGADHRFSGARELALLTKTIDAISQNAIGSPE